MILTLVLLAHVGSTLYMTGVIWLIQLVHYPLFNRVAPEQFIGFEHDHSQWITYVVLPPMVIELATAIALLVLRPQQIPLWILIAGLALVLLIWVSTFAIQVPQHTRLAQGFEQQAHQFLVTSNWIRTAAWTVRSALVLLMLVPFIKPGS